MPIAEKVNIVLMQILENRYKHLGIKIIPKIKNKNDTKEERRK